MYYNKSKNRQISRVESNKNFRRLLVVIKEIKKTAFDFTKANFGGVLLAFLPALILSLIFGSLSASHSGVYTDVSGAVTDNGGVGVHIGSLFDIIPAILVANLVQVFGVLFKKYPNGSKVSSGELTLTSSFKNLSQTFFPIILVVIAMYVIGLLFGLGFAFLVVLAMFAPIPAFFALVLALGVFVWLLIRLSLADNIVVDVATNYSGRYSNIQGTMNPFKMAGFALKESWVLTSGQVGTIILLGLSLIGWLLLACVTLGLALIFVYPYFSLVNIALYEKLQDNVKHYNQASNPPAGTAVDVTNY